MEAILIQITIFHVIICQIYFRQDHGLPLYISAEQGIHPKRIGSKKPVQTLKINSGPTASGPKDCPNHTSVTHIQKA